MQEKARIAAFIAEGSAAVRTTYADGGQNAIFAALMRKGANLGEISRPEALAFAGVDEIITPARGRCARKGGCPGETETAKAPSPAQPAPVEDKPPQIILAATHARAIPATDPAVLAPTPLSYKLGRPAPVQSFIAGAMPVMPAVLVD